MKELSKAYEPNNYEANIYKKWEDSGYFNPDNIKSDGESFTISMPPPNATGTLHLGHATMLAIQDLMVRYNRMLGKKTLWLPGTDHAAIATQNVVEKQVYKEQNKTRFDFGRDEFVKMVSDFAENSKTTIRSQVRAMGASCDWSRERYTLDEGLSKAVREVFVRMYNDGLIYRGKRIVNWCYRCGTTLADDEVDYKEQKTKFYYLKYGPIVIGTARPETKVLDKVIIVHPEDERYKDYVGKEFDVPWIDGTVKARVVADKVAEMETGTGAMTITPAHSFVDFELAQKYGFEIVDIIGADGKLTTNAGKFAGLNVKAARQAIMEELEAKGLVDHIDENYVHNLSVCYRCGTPVEPLPSEQWFVAVDKEFTNQTGVKTTLKKSALEAVKSGEIKIIPDRFEKVYDNWMNNLHDWCISRQIWFGHRVPVWYKAGDKKEIYVGIEAPQGDGWEQDPDTLDTWFSSGLWTFSTLGWPTFASQATAGKLGQENDLANYHPTSVMETGYDILFFWVARMILMSTYALGQIPFRNVYLHGLVRDKQGRKMSKSLGNGIDPLLMIEKYGADALRLSMIIGTSAGNDFRLYEEKISGYRNFVNKLWNINRFIIMSVPELKIVEQVPSINTLSDKWIISRFTKVQTEFNKLLQDYNFSLAGELLYDFTWHELADWYLEVAKIEGGKDEILSYLVTQLLKLWHPYTPYVTEVLWHEAFGEVAELLMIQPWPTTIAMSDEQSEGEFEMVKQIVTALRNYRTEKKLNKENKLQVEIEMNDFNLDNKKSLIEGLRTGATVVSELSGEVEEIKLDKGSLKVVKS